MALQSTGYLVDSSDSGSWLDGFLGWAGDAVQTVGDNYIDRWLSEHMPETAQPFNPDEPENNITAEAGATATGGFLGNPDNQKLLMVGAGVLVLALVLK
jgi:hypothetical protein